MLNWIYFFIILCSLHICYTDINFRIIKNMTVFFIIILSSMAGFFYYKNICFIPAVFIIAIGFIISWMGFVGAGDIKLIAAFSLSLNSEMTLIFLFMVTLSGLPLALYIMAVKNFSGENVETKMLTIPYGLAIVSGYIITTVIFKAPL